MTELVGLADDLALFRVLDDGLVLNTKTLDLTDPMPFVDIRADRYTPPAEEFDVPDLWVELVNAASCSLDIRVAAGGQRTYAVPKVVQNEARRALDWASNRNGISEIALGTAKKLASGRPVTLETVRYCSRYFPANAGLVDRHTGWSVGSSDFPSKDRVTYSAWGGDPGKRWSRRVISAHDGASFAIQAAGDLPDVTEDWVSPSEPHMFSDDGSDPPVCSVCDLPADDPIHSPDGAAEMAVDIPAMAPEAVDPDAVDPDDPHMYRDDEGDGFCDICQREEGSIVHVSMGSALVAATPTLEDADAVLNDFYSDFILPGTDDLEGEGDPDQAMEDDEVESRLDEDPTFMVRVDNPDQPEKSKAEAMYVIMPDGQVMCWKYGMWQPADLPEAEPMVELDDETAEEIGYSFYQNPDEPVALAMINPGEAAMFAIAAPQIDWTLVDRITAITAAPNDPTPGVYTPEERSKNATNQVRDKNGRFAKYGSQVRMPDGSTGYITRVDPDTQSVEVESTDGERSTVRADTIEVNQDVQAEPSMPVYTKPDYSGLEAKPRATNGTPVAWLPTSLPVMGAEELQKWIDAWITGVDATRSRGGSRTAAAGQPDLTPAVMRAIAERYRGTIIAAGEAPAAMTPETTDVKPLYLAIVDALDKQAVTDLIVLVPASATSSQPVAWRREPNQWTRADDMLAALRSVNPPPVVSLDDPTYQMVLAQVDGGPVSAENPSPAPQQASGLLLYGPHGEILPFAMSAAGGADRNRGDAEKLRRYWTHGEGAAKIRWGTKGDFNRCVRLVEKHMPGRAKGYCNLRHKEATGEYPPTHAKHEREHSADEYELSAEEAADIDAFVVPSEIRDLMTNEALLADGGADRNRGDAEKLRRYWTVGRGGAKIRWNTPGDWKRCYRHLAKYLGPRAKGYCALRHHEMTGTWTGSRENIGNRRGRGVFATEDEKSRQEFLPRAIYPFPSLDDLLTASALVAHGAVEIGGRDAPDTAEAVEQGTPFRIPLVIPEGVESGDGRTFATNALTTRDMPIPLMWQIQGDEGHSGAVIVGRVDKVDRIPGGLGNATGVMDTGPYAVEATRLIREQMLRGISADLDQFKAETSNPEEEEAIREAAEKAESGDDSPIEIKVDKSIGGDKMTITAARLMGVTLVAKPAFQECTIQLDDYAPSENEGEVMVPDGIYVEQPHSSEAEPLLASALIAASVPVTPPKTWFNDPQLAGATAIQVTDEGRVFGHIAAWDVDHIGLPFGTRPPRSKSGYAYFHTGALRTEEGDDVSVGQLTLAGGHASLNASFEEAVRHYDDTASAIADVHAGEDVFGIWVAGALRPGVSPEQVRALRASAPSGDWRPVRGALELVAVCQVNVPGFPITRARVASGTIMALVAAGASALALQRMRPDPVAEILDRLDRMERPRLAAEREATLARMAPALEKHREAMVASAAALRARMAPALDQHRADKVALVAAADAQRARVAALKFRQPFEEKLHPRDTGGKFKEVLFRLQAQQEQEAEPDPLTDEAISKLEEAHAAESEDRGDEADKAAQDAIELLDRAAADAVDPRSIKTLRQASTDVMTAIAHLPLDFANQAEKMRFSDVPEAGKEMLQSLIDRAETNGGAIAQEAIDIARNWMSGGDYINQSEFDAMIARLVKSLLV